MSFNFAQSKYLLSSLVIISLLVSVLAQINFDAFRRSSPQRINLTYNQYIEPQPLSAPAAKAVSFGNREFLADWYWLSLIQYYGGGDPYGKYRKLAEMFNLVTDLSPKFSAAYRHGLLILPGEGFTDEAIALGKKGEKNLPNDWQVPYYTGLVYHVYKKDYLSAAKEFDRAASLPGAPAITKLFSAIYYQNADRRQTAYAIFKTVAETTDDSFVRERAIKYVGHLEAYFKLTDAVQVFRTRYGRFPANLNELVDKKILAELPVSPLNIGFAYNPANGQITEAKR